MKTDSNMSAQYLQLCSEPRGI